MTEDHATETPRTKEFPSAVDMPSLQEFVRRESIKPSLDVDPHDPYVTGYRYAMCVVLDRILSGELDKPPT